MLCLDLCQLVFREYQLGNDFNVVRHVVSQQRLREHNWATETKVDLSLRIKLYLLALNGTSVGFLQVFVGAQSFKELLGQFFKGLGSEKDHRLVLHVIHSLNFFGLSFRGICLRLFNQFVELFGLLSDSLFVGFKTSLEPCVRGDAAVIGGTSELGPVNVTLDLMETLSHVLGQRKHFDFSLDCGAHDFGYLVRDFYFNRVDAQSDIVLR